ncbi:NADH-ubiquinone oxidoreductase-F iron-sulfur binding region domain-containing protein [Streptomyces sp. H27-D2]|uniref:NADH-ubiquinone oxidoreductase-F iron-sulfur binding region domain-containing protein n=1 Tax=Streptomyces sp. H27-D2 TaxID=3046304 RepID=UPI002DB654EC|nr:NADH-ubiquinone oxidoreductase-F iron-sulfur binding region domain-containing protein [Streptomyces sp. H27-D2]MEC4014816.1 NADH-ubiquinone oxidoreductase-F iron-sulfur binding region domain-containing protein [Streptomyces sp. H27-D2]
MNAPLDDTPDVLTLGLPRLTAGFDASVRLDRAAHLASHGLASPLREEWLTYLAEAVALRGRGGAGFPVARKMRAVAEGVRRSGVRPAIVVNGCEGEPASRKDSVLLCRAPHLVLDGALLAAEALDARALVIGVTREAAEVSVRAALAERGLSDRRGRPLRTRVVRAPDRLVSGEASSLIRTADGGPALPPGRRVRAAEAGLGGAPTLLCNAETFAQLALAARLGADGYAATGTIGEPGTRLLTVSGAVPRPLVVEVPSGVPLPYVLQMCGADAAPQGVLVGGYHGAWLDPATAYGTVVSHGGLATSGGALGAGAVLPLSVGTCPLGETLRVAHWLAAESAGQCGPCRLGLPSLAGALSDVIAGGGRSALEAVRQAAQGVRGRGACGHPDGAARFVVSALNAFTDDLAAHVLGNGCGRPTIGMLPLSAPGDGSTGDAGGSGNEGGGSERLAIDWTLCEGHGLCAGLLPELVRLGADGYPALADTPLPAKLRGRAQRAVSRCPALALRLDKT